MRRALRVFLAALAVTCLAAPPASASGTGIEAVPSGVLYDRVLPLSGLGARDGTPEAPPTSWRTWRQMVHEVSRASDDPAPWPTARELGERARSARRDEVLPLAVLDVDYHHIRPGSPEMELAAATAFAAAVPGDVTFSGSHTVFTFDAAWYLSNRGPAPDRLDVDFDDGLGLRSVGRGERIEVSYATPGRRTLTVRARWADGTERWAAAPLTVKRLAVPTPDDTLQVVADESYLGQYGTGEAFVLLSPANASLTLPVVVIEGFDLDNSLGWPELYDLLDQQSLVVTLHGLG
jgi:hypothetical protein